MVWSKNTLTLKKIILKYHILLHSCKSSKKDLTESWIKMNSKVGNTIRKLNKSCLTQMSSIVMLQEKILSTTTLKL